MAKNDQPTLSQRRTYDSPSRLTAAESQVGFISTPHIRPRIGYTTYCTLLDPKPRPYTPNEAKELLEGERMEWLNALKTFSAIGEVRTLRLEHIHVPVGPARELAEKLADEIRVLMKKRVGKADAVEILIGREESRVS
jgi:hypothetical protein